MRNAMLSGAARPYPDEKVQYDLSHVATLLFEQMKLNPDYRLRVSSIESVEFLLWRLLFDLVISVTCEVLSDSTLKETPIDTTESVALYLSHLLK